MSPDPATDTTHDAPTTDASDGLPRVTAVLVVSEGAEWLREVLATLARQRYAALDLVVVDNATTDGSGEVLARRIPSDRLIRLSRRVGFPRAVAAASQHEAVAGADFLLLWHDDLALHPDALAQLVEVMHREPSLGMVGPKLREWSEEPLLQQVGMTADRFGRAESALEAGELDQGQHDGQRETLYVSTAGMLIRGDLFRRLGGLDPRFVMFRDDLDLCWRAWLAGYRVEVVPSAVGYHVAATSRLVRRISASDGRAMAERHGLAALLKNYSASRLSWVMPVTVLLALGKTLGFLATRRFGDAFAVVRAYLWNIAQFPRTLRRRRAIQSRRVVSDAKLSRLFASGLTRVRDYGEAAGGWLAGGSAPVLLDDEEAATALAGDDSRGIVRFVRAHPAASAGGGLFVVYLVGLVGLLGPGQLVGGQVAPWPESAREFLRAYASHWHGEPVGSGAFASPIQVALGLGSLLGFGSAWLAQRLLVLGLLPMAWLLAYRAGRLVTAHAAPRVLGATLYTLSPAVVLLLAEGRFGVLVFAALSPGLVLLAVRVLDPRSRIAVAWRAAALLALGGATVVAAAPASAPVLGVAYLVALGVAARRRYVAIRMGVAGFGALAILAPWLVDVVRQGLGGHVLPSGPLPLWRALTAAPSLPAGPAAVDVAAGVTALAIVAAAILLGLRTRPGAVSALAAVVGVAGLAAWGAAREEVGTHLVPALLVMVALALAGLGVIGARCLVGELRGYAFGGRQLAAVSAAVLVGLGVLGGVARVATGPWDDLSREPELVPAFVDADQPEVGPYRVLVLAAGDEVNWDLVQAGGPSMLDYGTLPGRELLRQIDEAVTAAVGGTDPQAGTALGVANVRYVVVSDRRSSEQGVAEVTDTLSRQPALEPLPSGGGRVFSVQVWLPRAAVLPTTAGQALLATGDPGSTTAVEHEGLSRVRPGVYSGSLATSAVEDGGGLLVVSETTSPRWTAHADGERLPRREAGSVNAFTVPPGAEEVTVAASGGFGHYLALSLQALLALAVGSLALRPPVFARRRVQRAGADSLPEDLTAEDAARGGQDQEWVPS